jgi:hypothetical protein
MGPEVDLQDLLNQAPPEGLDGSGRDKLEPGGAVAERWLSWVQNSPGRAHYADKDLAAAARGPASRRRFDEEQQ